MINRSEIDNTRHQGIAVRLGHILRDVLVGFDALYRIQYDRPWERMERDQERRADRPRIVKH